MKGTDYSESQDSGYSGEAERGYEHNTKGLLDWLVKFYFFTQSLPGYRLEGYLL